MKYKSNFFYNFRYLEEKMRIEEEISFCEITLEKSRKENLKLKGKLTDAYREKQNLLKILKSFSSED